MQDKARRTRAKERAKGLIGQRFGYWTVVGYAGERKSPNGKIRQFIEIRCVCGTKRRELLKRPGRTQSCGCQAKQSVTMTPEERLRKQEAERKKVKERVQQLRLTKPSYYLYELARKRAEVRSGRVKFTLTPEDIVVPKTCPLTGVRLVSMAGQKGPSSPTLLRLDPKRPWEKGNVSVVSWKGAKEHERRRKV